MSLKRLGYTLELLCNPSKVHRTNPSLITNGVVKELFDFFQQDNEALLGIMRRILPPTFVFPASGVFRVRLRRMLGKLKTKKGGHSESRDQFLAKNFFDPVIVPPPRRPDSSASPNAYLQEIERLKSEIHSLNIQHKTECKELEQKLSSNGIHLKKIESENEVLAKKISELQQTYSEVQKEKFNLTKQVSKLNYDIAKIESENLSLSSKLNALLENEKKIKESELSMKSELDSNSEKYNTVNKRLAGIKSAYSKLKNLSASHQNSNQVFKNVAINTDIHDTMNKDMLIIEPDNSNKSYVTGKLHKSCAQKSKPKKYFKIPTLKCNLLIKKRQTHNRAKQVIDFIDAISGTNEHKEKTKLLSQVIQFDKNIFMDAAQMIGIKVQTQMSVSQATQMVSLLRLPTAKVRELRRILKNTGIGNILPSEQQLRLEQSKLTSYLSEDKLEVGKIHLCAKVDDNKVVEKAYVRVTDLHQFIEDLYAKIEHFRNDSEFNNEIWLLFSGDKGGTCMKFHLEIINDAKSGSRDVVHPYCMFEATDTMENMWKVYGYYREAIIQLQKPEFELSDCRKVRLFLGGDYAFLSTNLGHQGQSATYPSPIDLVTLEHLRGHSDKPHTPNIVIY